MISNVRDTRWWKADEPHQVVFDNIKQIRDRSSLRAQMDLYHACLYDDSELTGLGPASYDEVAFEPSRLAFNVVRQAVDTLAAKIAKNQPLPMPVTSGGNFRQQRRAKKFGKMIGGQFDAAGVWRLSPTIARDCALFGTGLSHNYRVGKTIIHERVFPWEIAIDARDAMYGKPRVIYMRRWVDRFVLADRFPDFEPEIMAAESDRSDTFDLGYDDTSDLVLVVEAWHLPSAVLDDNAPDKTARGKPLHDGKHVICIANKTLFEEPWRRQYFPFSVLRMSDPVVGWFGTGLAKQLTGLQYTINDTASVVQEAHALSGGYILVENGSNVDPEKLVNGRGVILKYNGAKPDWISPQPLHPDTMNFVMALIPKAFEMTGVSQLSAQSQKPAGIESAIALNTFNDIETERFALFAKQYEEYHIDIAWQFFDLAEEINKEFGSYTVKVATRERGSRVLDEIDYANVRLDREQFVLEVFASNLLSKKPAARLQEIEQLINAGWISPEDGKELLEFPDLERFGNLSQASSRIIAECIDRILDAEDPYAEGVYTYPEPEFNLKMCVAKGLVMYLDAKLEGAPQENLDMVLQFVADAQAQLAQAAASAPAPQDPSILPPDGGDPNAPPGGPVPPDGMVPPAGLGAPPIDGGMPPIPDAGMPVGPPMGPPMPAAPPV